MRTSVQWLGMGRRIAREGGERPAAKRMKGRFAKSRAVRRGNLRLMYIARLGEVIYALHGFQKEAHYGIATPQHELNLIAQRLGFARAIAREG